MPMFVRLTLGVAALLVVLVVVAFLFKIVVLAAFVAAVAIAIGFVVNFVRKRRVGAGSPLRRF